MAQETMLWNVDQTRSIKAARIREFDITPYTPLGEKAEVYELNGWTTAQEYFNFGRFPTGRAAQEYLGKLHRLIEGKAGVDYNLLRLAQWGTGEVSRHTFTLYDRDLEILNRLSEKLNVKKSVLIRYLLKVLDRDM
jgi:hypothetical protein